MRKMQKFTEPGLRLCLLLMAAFAAVTWFFNDKLAYAEAGVVAALIVYAVIRNRTRQRELQAFVESVTYNTESATNNTLIHFPLPMAVFRLGDSGVVWANQPFWDMCGRSGPAFDARLDELVPDFSGKWLMEGKNRMADLVEIGEKKFQVNGNMVRAGQSEETYEFMGITYWVDVTEYDRVREEYYNSRPVVMIILVDNYDEMMKPLTDRQRTELLGLLDGAVEKWCEGKGGILRRTDRDRYMFIFEKRYLDEITRERFTLVESIHSLVSPTGIHATVSIGAGLDGAGYEEDYSFAALAEDMALSRGGDQAVVKNRYNFEFFGGRGTEVETRTKVRSRVTANSLSRLIGDASQVFVMSHKYADNDSVGSAVGIACIARKLGRDVKIVVGENSPAQALVEMISAEEKYAGVFINPQEAILRADSSTLLVVVDTNRPEQVENDTLLTACASRLAVIDHHRRAATYIQNPTLSLYEPKASSACELVTEMMQELVEPSDILPAEADAVLAGIVLDTKNFTIRTVDRTFDAAAFLERAGADTSRVRELYKNGLEETLARYDLIRQAKVHRGIALVAARETQSRVLAAQTADELLNISGVEASAVLYPMEGGGVAISARSVGKVNVQVLLEQLGGGGNKSAAGAQIPDIDLREAFNRLCAAIDKYMDTE
ncbi:MAG: DHH family phosphoesterase [Oscillospiraceae bacterium]|nr:DHH family phosphoesterase [Oscillospiraceae bacterium]